MDEGKIDVGEITAHRWAHQAYWYSLDGTTATRRVSPLARGG
jgi:hypothetical protein